MDVQAWHIHLHPPVAKIGKRHRLASHCIPGPARHARQVQPGRYRAKRWNILDHLDDPRAARCGKRLAPHLRRPIQQMQHMPSRLPCQAGAPAGGQVGCQRRTWQKPPQQAADDMAIQGLPHRAIHREDRIGGTGHPPVERHRRPQSRGPHRIGRVLVRREAEKRPDFIKIWYVVTAEETVEKNRPMVHAAIRMATFG